MNTYPPQDRASVLAELEPTFTAIYQDVVAAVDPGDIDAARVHHKLRPDYRHGVALLYGAGLATWQTMRDSLAEVDFGDYFTSEQKDTLAAYSFNTTPERVSSAFIQSAMTAPTIFMAWWADATNRANRNVQHRQWCREVETDVTLNAITSTWFSKMLAQGSITNSGLYRNSTGLDLSFVSHMTRSALRPLQRFEAISDGEKAMDVDGDEPKLSEAYLTYIRNRLRIHNQTVRQEEDSERMPFDGTSAGCPVARGKAEKPGIFALATTYLAEVMERTA